MANGQATTTKTIVRHRGLWFVALEFIAIVFGVFLGGYLAERRAGRDLDDIIVRSEQAIYAELKTNYNQLLAQRTYHIRQYDNFTAAMSGSVPLPHAFGGMTMGFNILPVQTGSYDAAVAAGLVVYMDTEEFAQISRAYSISKLNDDMDDLYVAALLNDDSEGRRLPQLFSGAFRQFIIAEDNALQVLAPLVGEEAPEMWSPRPQPRATPQE